ncbi:MAG: NosD domain-containing protein, partial [Methanobacteriaceae archaeon]|nr:NosD domain-containing protein [Methanobacteriaceae archaeon]
MVMFKRVLLLVFVFLSFFVFLGDVSAASNSSLTWAEVENSSYAVQTFTESKGDIPSSVSVSGKKVTDNAYLEVLCKAVVKANTNDKTSVSVVGRGNAPAPSGSASGTLTKSQYLTVANNIKSFYTDNNRAPNYAVSSIGNIRYETLVYMYSKVMNYYRIHDTLPSSISFSHISGISSSGAYVDATPPTISNNLAGGSYNSSKTVVLTASDNSDANPKVYYSLNNGAWSNKVKTVSLSLNQGRTDLRYYGTDVSGNVGATHYVTYYISAPVCNLNTGKGYSRIQDAIDDSLTLNGHVIEVARGTYNENIWVDKSLNIRAVSGGNVTVQALNSSLSCFYVISGGNNSSINGFNIKGSTFGGIFLYKVSNCNITGNTLINNGNNGIWLYYSNNNSISRNSISNNLEGIIIQYSNNNNISENNATNITENGIYIYNSNNTLISRNNVKNSLTGILIDQSKNNTISKNNATANAFNGIVVGNSNNINILENSITDNIQNGIFLTKLNGTLISGNSIRNNGINGTIYGGIIIDYSNNTIIFGNNVTNNTENGILLTNSKYNIISGNNVTNNIKGIILQNAINNTLSTNNVINSTENGIHLLYSSNSTISGNTIKNNLNIGICLDNSYCTKITENTIVNNKGGIYLYFSPASVNFNRITGNTMGGLINAYSSFVNATNNWWGSNTPTVSSSNASDICILGGNVLYNPWIILNVDSVYFNNGNFNITADLTHNNQGTDLSSIGHVPDGIAVDLTTDYGTIGEHVNTLNGKAISQLNSTINGIANITVILDSQIVSKTINLFNIYNIVTQKGFNSIQAAIDDPSTANNDIIEIRSGIYRENVIINKKLTITAFSGGNVTIQALNPNLPVFTITINGNGSTISGFIINGSTTNAGILINNSANNTISGNIISNNCNGLYLRESTNNTISENIISNNGNDGININHSYNNTIRSNTISNNTGCGINIFDYSGNSNFVNFNRIVGNGFYGLYVEEGLINATNNWWGTNNPVNSLIGPSDIAIEWGNVTYGPWLVLNVNANPTDINNNSTVTADLTHNSNNEDTSSEGHIPDDTPVNFTTTLVNAVNSVYTRNGKAILIFNSGTITSGIANITAALDGQSVQTNIVVDKIAPTVNASLVSGLYNITQYVTLTVSDNIDSNPIIYYTIDGSIPTVSSTVYSGPMVINTTTTLKFMAFDFTSNKSPISTVYYIFAPVGNLNTGMGYSSIQNAINDVLTVNGDVIVVANGTYLENILANKNLTLMPYDGNVTVQAANPNNPVITINSGGSGSTILRFAVTGANATFSSGIYLNNASNCTIVQNILTNNYHGLLFVNSEDNTVWDNNLTSNMDAIQLNDSDNNTLYSNTIASNSGNGIYLYNSGNTLIMANTIHDNLINGIELNDSNNSTIYQNTIIGNHQNGIKIINSSADINFNIITGNAVFGLYSLGNGTVNATNNWWGRNNLTASDISIVGGNVTYDPWIVLSLTGSTITVTHNNSSDSEITADLNHNNRGDDTSASGTIPDSLPVNFTTTFGTINGTGTIRRGEAVVVLTSSPSDGATTITVTLNNQQVSKEFHKSFSSIQVAVSDPLTVDGDVIFVTNGTYVENIVVNKNLTIISEGNVTVQALNSSNPVFTVNNCSDSMIYGFKITGATNSSAIYLNGVINCYLLDNTIIGNGLNSTGEFGYGIFMNSTINCTVTGNILQNNLGGIDLEYSNNTILSGNNITNNFLRGIYLHQTSNTTISESSLANNDCGVLSEYSNNLKITGNDVKNNIYQGIYLCYSSGDLHFNRIVGNGEYGLLSVNSNVNATNNWWGTNNPTVSSVKPSDIYFANSTVIYNPRLVLTVTPTSYKVSEGKIYESTVTVDLNHNSNGEHLSTLIYVPDGILANFMTDKGNITNASSTVKGEASATLVLDPNLQSGLTNVTAILDGQGVFTTVDRAAKAVITIISSAVDANSVHWVLNWDSYYNLELTLGEYYGMSVEQYCYMMYGDPYAYLNHYLMPELYDFYYTPLILTYEVPLNESVSWVSVLWKSTGNDFGSFQNKVDLIVNGVVVQSKIVLNLNYLNNKDLYSEKVWYNVNFLNWLFSDSTESIMTLQSIIDQNGLQNLTGSALEAGILNVIKLNNGFTDSEMNMIANHRFFTDYIATYITYPGDAVKKITFEDPDTNELISLGFPGNPIGRVSTMIYANGGYFHVDDYDNPTSFIYKKAGYEGVRSFAIVTTKVTDDILRYWLEQKDKTDSNGTLLYANGPMKAAYGTFLEALLMIKCHDMVADQAAAHYNVTWSRTTPIVVSVYDDAHYTILTLECSHRFG